MDRKEVVQDERGAGEGKMLVHIGKNCSIIKHARRVKSK